MLLALTPLVSILILRKVSDFQKQREAEVVITALEKSKKQYGHYPTDLQGIRWDSQLIELEYEPDSALQEYELTLWLDDRCINYQYFDSVNRQWISVRD